MLRTNISFEKNELCVGALGNMIVVQYFLLAHFVFTAVLLCSCHCCIHCYT